MMAILLIHLKPSKWARNLIRLLNPPVKLKILDITSSRKGKQELGADQEPIDRGRLFDLTAVMENKVVKKGAW